MHAGLTTVIARLVFILYADGYGLLPEAHAYPNHYSVNVLFERLRTDSERHPDDMDCFFFAWKQLLILFRAVHDGVSHVKLSQSPRHGALLNPALFPFLDGDQNAENKGQTEQTVSPLFSGAVLISDAVVFRILQNLMELDGEFISYERLDVEQIGSIYESLIGFTLVMAKGRSIAIKPIKPHAAPTAIDLDALLKVPPSRRAKWIKKHTNRTLSGTSRAALKNAQTPEEAVAAIENKIATDSTPAILPRGAMLLQPSKTRRQSGSHYTPRSFTESIVQTALRPVFERIGDSPTPEQILALKICDPAMGSGAFLLEACRQLGIELVRAWHVYRRLPAIDAGDDEIYFARRMVAQHCLYGVDKNPMAVELARLSFWLETRSRAHAFTFLDHALRHGDSLVGLTPEQIINFHWSPPAGHRTTAKAAKEFKLPVPAPTINQNVANPSKGFLGSMGDLVVSCFFKADSPSSREHLRFKTQLRVRDWILKNGSEGEFLAISRELTDPAIIPFHWEQEFPDVFCRENPGFDAIVGNPPFAGKNTLANSYPRGYPAWLMQLHPESNGNADLAAHFFRRAFTLLRNGGSFGLIATNTISQGDTRTSGLGWICTHGGVIYAARRRYKWPGQAAVVISTVHVFKGKMTGPFSLDGGAAPRITAYLFHRGENNKPVRLRMNAKKSFQGSIVLGMGFTFDDADTKGIASPLAAMHRLIEKDARNRERIFPYIGGEEVNSSPAHAHRRYVINFGDLSEHDARRDWPDLMKIVEEKVKRDRLALPPKNGWNKSVAAKWWLFGAWRKELNRIASGMKRVLMHPFTSTYLSFVFLPASTIISGPHNVFVFDSYGAFCVLQSRVHEVWVRFFASSMKDDLRYTPTDCFETFPFPVNFVNSTELISAGAEYYEYRGALMLESNEGLTRVYNRFHDPNEHGAGILKLRVLHAAMDRAVLNAYGWTNLEPVHEFQLDFEDEDEKDTNSIVARRKRKPWRYRWTAAYRDEVLARLLDLNESYAKAERLDSP